MQQRVHPSSRPSGSALVVSLLATSLLLLGPRGVQAQAPPVFDHLTASRLYVFTETAYRPDLLFTEADNIYTSFPRNLRAYEVQGNRTDFLRLSSPSHLVKGWVGRPGAVDPLIDTPCSNLGQWQIVAALAALDVLIPAALTLFNQDTPTDFSGCADCQIHSGILQIVLSIKAQALAQIKKLHELYPDDPIYLTGHSAGAVVATLLALDVQAELGITPTVLATGMPVFANSNLASYITTQLQGFLFRVTTPGDPLPHIRTRPIYVHPEPQIFYRRWLGPDYLDCGQVPCGASASAFISLTGQWQRGPPARIGTFNTFRGDWLQPLLLQAHHGYFQEDGKINYCAAYSNDLQQFEGCLVADADLPGQFALLKRQIEAGATLDYDLEDVVTADLGPLYSRRQQYLAINNCTGRAVEDLRAHLQKFLLPCLAARSAERWQATGNRPNALPNLGQCLASADPLLGAGDCVATVQDLVEGALVSNNSFLPDLFNIVGPDSALPACLAQYKPYFLRSPFAKSTCRPAQQLNDALRYICGPQEVHNCLDKDAMTLNRNLLRLDACVKLAVEPGQWICTIRPDKITPSCQRLSASPNTATCACLTAAKPWLAQAIVPPTCKLSFPKLQFYQQLLDRCDERNPAAITARPLNVSRPITYGYKHATNGLLFAGQIVTCLNIDVKSYVTTLNVFENSDKQQALARCLTNPSINSADCLQAIVAFIDRQQGASNWFGSYADILVGAPRPCDCFARATQSLVGNQMFQLTYSEETQRDNCKHFATLIASYNVGGYLTGINDLCHRENGFADRCTEYCPTNPGPVVPPSEGAASVQVIAESTSSAEGKDAVEYDTPVGQALQSLRGEGGLSLTLKEVLGRLMRKNPPRHLLERLEDPPAITPQLLLNLISGPAPDRMDQQRMARDEVGRSVLQMGAAMFAGIVLGTSVTALACSMKRRGG